ncbi:uncharacterized protein [Penaeus vannamei]|uniref:uncharacterized protein n=1 Tax=Penaeus vannamei TaxID=6689 RepID=UPI00387F5366
MEDRGGIEVAQTGCCITKCKNSAFLADVVLFTFPNEAERKGLWMKLLREHMTSSNTKAEPRICSDHFRSSDIVRTSPQPELSAEALPHVQGSDKRDVRRELKEVGLNLIFDCDHEYYTIRPLLRLRESEDPESEELEKLGAPQAASVPSDTDCNTKLRSMNRQKRMFINCAVQQQRPKDFPEDDMLDVQSESEEDFGNSESPSAIKGLSIMEEGSGPGSGSEMSLGPEGKTKVQIVNTGETSMVNGKENLIYHVITTTGGTSTVTPLTVPKEVSSDQNEESEEVPSTSQTEKGGGDAAVPRQNLKRAAASRTQSMKNKRIVRTYNQKLGALRQQYSRAVQELRKRRLYTLADLVCGASRFLTEEQLVFFTLQLKSGCHNMQGVRYSVREKILALAFYLQSPALYKWLRAIFHLPTKLILERWLEGIAKSDPDTAKRLMYHVYTKYIFKQ